ncbi:hypothetical protein RFK24_07355, partial [Streptococcus suis]
RVRVNISAQWLIGRFVRVLHSKSDLINCAGGGGGKTNSFLTGRVLSRSLFLFGRTLLSCPEFDIIMLIKQ